jgi:nucleoside-diphosphate-sugar epimerase
MSSQYIVSPEDRLLVTGANGFIGSRVVRSLLQLGFNNLTCLVRPTSRLTALDAVISEFSQVAKVTMVRGDLTSAADCRRAVTGARVVLHLAAGFDKSFAGAFMNSALATRNLVEAFLEGGQALRVVNVSSFAVYSNLGIKKGALLDESSPLEDKPHERWDAYGYGKLKQEEIIRRYALERKLPYVILRPGAVFGPGKKELSGRIGVGTFGIFMHIGGGNVLPLTYVDNCADAVALAGVSPNIDGRVFNVVDDDPWTSRQVLAAYKSTLRGFRSVRVPYWAASLLCRGWEWYSRASRGQVPPAFNRRRCAADWKGNRYSNAPLKDAIGWRPKVSMEEGMRRFLGQFTPEDHM